VKKNEIRNEVRKLGLPMQKIPVKRQTLLGTFFWVELRCKQIIARNGTCETTAVVSFPSHFG
jgi:hypothetical protein